VWQGEAVSFLDAMGEALLENFCSHPSRLDYSGHDLSGVPAVPDIDRAILEAIDRGGRLCMDHWHGDKDDFAATYEGRRCGTTHCRAGWAIRLAGQPGYDLEDRFDAGTAGALIYAASRPGVPVPDFYASDEQAMADIRACAGR